MKTAIYEPNDDLSVGNHHSNSSEEHLEVLWQFLSPRVPGILWSKALSANSS